MIQKINQDIDSKRHQKNMTNTQRKNDNYSKEGVIINSYVKDPLLSLDETLDTLVISETQINLPEKIQEKDIKNKNALLPVCIASVGVMGGLAVITKLINNFSKKRLESSQELLLPGITRNHCINNEIHQSIFSLIQSPNRKTILASIGVISLGTMAFIAKNIIDAAKDIWIKNKEADIQKNLQENLIAIETQAFAGKIQIIRSMLSEKAKLFVNEFSNYPNFKKTDQNKSNNNIENKKSMLLILSSLITTFIMGYIICKNLRSSDDYIKKGIENTKHALENIINDYNKNKELKNLIGSNGELLEGKEAYKFVIENLFELMNASAYDIEQYISKLNLNSTEKETWCKDLKKAMNQATEKVNPMMGGSGRNKITYFSHVNEYLSFFYDWLMNPKNPQFKNLFLGISGISALSYCGKTYVEAQKEYQVKKYNADIELNLQKRLISTELRNFYAKKKAAIEPLCDEFFVQKNSGKSKEDLKIMADNILFEIKNGPPFVYS